MRSFDMSGLYLNYCFCDITENEEKVYAINYTNQTDLAKYRNDYPDYIFYRTADKVLFCHKCNDKRNAALPDVEYILLPFSTKSNPAFVCRLLEEKISDVLKSTKRYEIYFEKFSKCLVAKKVKPVYSDDVLDVFSCCKFKTYFFEQNEKVYVGFSVSHNLKYSFKISKTECGKYNFDSDGLFENRNGKIAANTRAISRYKEVLSESSLTEIDKIYMDRDKQFLTIKKTIDWLSERLIGNLYGEIKIISTKSNYLPYDDVFDNEVIAAPKRYYANDKFIAGKPSQALIQAGPYMAQTCESNVKITLIALKDNEGSLNVFTRELSDKMFSLFRLNLIFDYVWLPNNSTEAFLDAVLPVNSKNADVAIFILKKDIRYMNPNVSPYYPCKAKLIGQEVPTQCICIETIKRVNDFILGNIALNLYAKIGGTAWGIEKKATMARELIIGIGATVNYKKQLTMSIANVFDNSGVYLAGACKPITDTDNYVDELEKLIRELFDSVLYGEKKVHLIFHIFKSIGQNKEIKALENVLRTMHDVEISYSFVHLGYGHNFRIFSDDGKATPKKGQYIQLNQSESLLLVNERSVVPLKISIDRRSTFTDIYYITQQAFYFSHLSARSFIPSKKPITILYPSIMANLVDKLKMVKSWDYDKLRVKGVTEKLWFL